eukprot:SAG31_NODE_704_length_12701_cov_17.271306_3_plen_192_part_00
MKPTICVWQAQGSRSAARGDTRCRCDGHTAFVLNLLQRHVGRVDVRKPLGGLVQDRSARAQGSVPGGAERRTEAARSCVSFSSGQRWLIVCYSKTIWRARAIRRIGIYLRGDTSRSGCGMGRNKCSCHLLIWLPVPPIRRTAQGGAPGREELQPPRGGLLCAHRRRSVSATSRPTRRDSCEICSCVRTCAR